jgi:hypothetical protein
MDQEREHYRDGPDPLPRHWPWDAISVLLGIGLFVFIVVACILLPFLNSPEWP